MLRALTTLILLFAFWLMLSGMFAPFLVAAGFGCALAVLLMARHMNRISEDGQPIHLRWLAFATYHPWLIKEILFSAWDVTKRILDPRLPITPTLVEFTPAQTTDSQPWAGSGWRDERHAGSHRDRRPDGPLS